MRIAHLFPLIVLIACSSEPQDDGDIPAQPTPPGAASAGDPAGTTNRSPYKRSYPDRLVQNTYTVAVDGCYYDSPAKLASDLGVVNDPDAIARAYSMSSQPGVHRDASYVGCLEGLSAPGAGMKKQFGK